MLSFRDSTVCGQMTNLVENTNGAFDSFEIRYLVESENENAVKKH